MHIYRWDLDKTYLDTDIESVRGLIRAGLQRADEKRNVPGSRALLRALTTDREEARVFVLSGSPTQMRKVLSAKLALDGIVVDEIVLKNNLRNLRRGRLRAVRDQLGYKLPQLLVARSRGPADATETLFGDDSEVDALVYAAYAAAVRGDLDARGLEKILRAGKAYDDTIGVALDALRQIPNHDAVDDIFIHCDRGVPADRFQLLGPGIWPVFNWLQAALRLHDTERLDAEATATVLLDAAAGAALTPSRVANLIQDSVRRQLISSDRLRVLMEHPRLTELHGPAIRAVQRLGDLRAPLPQGKPRYLDFLRA